MTSWLLLIIGIMVFLWFTKKYRELEKYEFENRSSGGTVSFESFEASERHHRKKGLYRGLMGIGFFMAFIGFGIIFL